MPSPALHPSTTARPADKGIDTKGIDPASLRLAVDGVCRWSAANGRPMRRREAREWVRQQYATHPPADHDGDELTPAQMGAWLRSLFRQDPTGITAIRNVSRGRGGGS